MKINPNKIETIADLRASKLNTIKCSVVLYREDRPFDDYATAYDDIDEIPIQYDCCKVMSFFYKLQTSRNNDDHTSRAPHGHLKIYANPEDIEMVESLRTIPPYITQRCNTPELIDLD